MAIRMQIEHSYADTFAANLDAELVAPSQPAKARDPQWLAFNADLATQLGIPESLHATQAGLELYSGAKLPDWAQPVALGYAGHQFANFVPRLGDGRALLLAELVTADQQRFDMQLKGSGTTPFSRGGDGKAPLGPVMREFLVSEAMHALGVPTTRALAAVATGDWVQRDEAQPGAIITRIAKSHLRIGTAQFVAQQIAQGADESLRQAFADYVIQRHYPLSNDRKPPYRALLRQIIDQQAHTVAHWMSLGFVHGVMNTDNMTLSGETIDYGPCAFMENYDPNAVFSAIDRAGRYAYKNQPGIALWNLARLAEAWLPLLAKTGESQEQLIESVTELVHEFPIRYEAYYDQKMALKLGLRTPSKDTQAVVRDWLGILNTNQLDFTLSFRRLADVLEIQDSRFNHLNEWNDWYQSWQQLLSRQQDSATSVVTRMRQHNPAVIPRNHWVEASIQETLRSGELKIFNELAQVLRTPYDFPTALSRYAEPAAPEQRVTRTFCGT
ncbi:YdiU family protein [Pseudidiomarina aestuarii]|uniref:Protein nucleotidyltransferase YdiU n=1 Tax=Pseudidiomarina aestuarii TaxID=624146 RepID=A0A2T4D1J5_9GAMM|nr:YdiU family protein [Pseudidiomarina aestuarii]PTB89470.1 YdiU family protein [Pseudidiomarina aestuarii]PTB89709.1 YdiU family protein [Pseudidiomarina aestuarii]